MVPVKEVKARHPAGRIGLALGSGSARGLAHLGVIRALTEAGIEVDCIAGTSIGALVGAIHAAGKLDSLAATFQDFDWKRTLSFFDVVLPKSGLIDGAEVGALVREHVRADAIEALAKPFAAVATDLASGAEVVLRQGDVIEAVRASISVPGIFTPVRRDGRILVDGGLTNPVPVSVARALGADYVIAVDLNHGIAAGKNLKPLRGRRREPAGEPNGLARWAENQRRALAELKARLLARAPADAAQFARWASAEEPLPNIFEVLLASINVMEASITATRLGLEPPDLLIRPPLGHIRFLEFGRAEEIIGIGYESTRRALAALAPAGPRTPRQGDARP
ncbi:patatin-like phospholipase family protein [Parasulfuritortus cantonensis]|uniref:patatin-like phospholipase family protein n=1 Tax=Parasulfuritortus cantonensis TaxID=2528202 RepID=UPI0014045EBC|nr:patatin-like phospholipase family protein [Parasulfuritortus cantonensis]